MIVIILTVRNINYPHIDEIVVIVTIRKYFNYDNNDAVAILQKENVVK